ncbi:MAG: alpha/beta hydrolase [Chromatiales bacterium]|nr:alpha/beta hydrolase [Gammaproteobacteria bacterium]MBW6476842.1 alpha/beta hydrolase [Chromatiales bacterium]
MSQASAQQIPNDTQQRRYALSGLHLASLYRPGEGLPVIALHGWLDNAASFVPLLPHLPNMPILVPDLPGHGHSAHLPDSASYHLADNARWVVALADAMGWQRFALLGHSMGSGAACITAAAVPQRVAGLVLIDGLGPLAYSPEQAIQRLQSLFAKAGQRRPSRALADLDTAVALRQRLGRFAIDTAAATLLCARGTEQREDGLHWRHDERLQQPGTHYFSEAQAEAVLRAIRCPAILISAEQGALLGWDGLARRKACVSGLQHVILPGGHHLHMEHPELVAAEIQHFLDSLVTLGHAGHSLPADKEGD